MLNMVASSASWCGDWYQCQSESQKDGIAVREKLTQLAPQFEINLMGDAGGETVFTTSSAVVGGATIYVGTSSGDVVAVEGKSGTESWRAPLQGPITGAPIAYGETVVVASTDGTLRALDGAANGAELWRFSPPGPLAGSPT